MVAPDQNLLNSNPTASTETQALNGGGVDNKQQISNFMNALQGVGAGSNNAQMQGAVQPGGAPGQLVNPGVAYGNNGMAGQYNQAPNYFSNVQGASQQAQNAGQGSYQAAWQPQPGSPLAQLFGNNMAVPMQGAPAYGQGNNITGYPGLGGGVPMGTAAQPGPNNPVNASTQQGSALGAIAPSTYAAPTQTAPLASTAYNPAGLQQANANKFPTTTVTPATYNPTLPHLQNLQAATSPGYAGGIRLSDETMKTNISDDKRSLQDFISNVGAWQYEYKEPEKDGQGTFFGPMAQELEKTPVGASAVVQTPRGKMVDTARLSLINTGALSVLNQTQDRLQAQIDELRRKVKL